MRFVRTRNATVATLVGAAMPGIPGAMTRVVAVCGLSLLAFSTLLVQPAHALLIINPTFDDASFTAAGLNVTAVHTAFNFAGLLNTRWPTEPSRRP